MPFAENLAPLRAVIDRIIPADDAPGALALGTDAYVLAQLDGDRRDAAAGVAAGLARLETAASQQHGRGIAGLAPGQLDALLAGVASEGWFTTLAELTAEGFYADPGNGGNRDGASWRIIGYEPRLPGKGATP